MTFLLLLAAVVIVRLHLLPHQPLIQLRLSAWRQYIESNELFTVFGRARLYLVIASPIVLLMLVAAVLQAWQWAVLEYLFYFLVLLACFDPADLRAGIDNYLNDLKREDIQAAFHDSEGVEAFGHEVAADSWSELHAQTLEATCLRYYEAYFPVIFWVAVLGVPGAFAYRLIQILSRLSGDPDRERTLRMKFILDWLPVRLFGLAVGIAGNFTPVMDQLRKTFMDTSSATGKLLSAYVVGAIHGDVPSAAFDSPSGEILELEELPPLVDRTLVIWLAAIGLIAVI